MLNDALRKLREKTKDHIDARDTERATLLSWPGSPSIEVDGDPEPYPATKLVFAEYLLNREVKADFIAAEYLEGNEPKGSVTGVLANGVVYETGEPYKQAPRSSLRGKLVIPSPLQVGDRLIVSRLSGQRYYVHGKDVGAGG
ncbi:MULTISPECIES: hypothetical protein [Paenibacillus]|uniref:Uncharacterized protein n=1 Tax=Paenibacillus polymyxa TaxID=1406 RepID=A0ABX2Z7Y5_PAEPO|nr:MULTISPECIES: hypothetical protein [Paenibacillus]ODA07370.1 hypothetical protein A7312_09775 [Paenibacillus polymyxa]OME69611.1 hypothetical protein BK119_14160 [Paenibacillus peoriae]